MASGKETTANSQPSEANSTVKESLSLEVQTGIATKGQRIGTKAPEAAFAN